MQKNAMFWVIWGKHFLQKTTTACFFSMLYFPAFAQQDFSAELRNTFDNYRRAVLQEKLFVHTDKSVYLTSEILWFKIYDVDAFFHMPLAVSSVAYVELLDKNNKPVLQAKLALSKGDGNGSLYLPGTLNSGNYKMRAYTNWMKNFSPDYFFEKSITIFNMQKMPSADSSSPKLRPQIGFFPEGGNLVEGLRSKVGFKVSDQYGKGLDCHGILMNDHGDTVLAFKTLNLGMGNFSFRPVAGQHYKAVVSFISGVQIVKELPPAYDHGYVMHLGQDGGQLEITVQQSPDSSAKGGEPIYLFIHTRQSVKYIGYKTMLNWKAVFLVDTARLGHGISQLTVFNTNKTPVCERLYFKYPEKLQLSVKTDQSAYGCRKKINLDIFSGDCNGDPTVADLSLAVYRTDSLQQPDEINIQNYLWLTSDLAGKIEAPDYYFSNRGPEITEALDNLLLTQGWRRFKWEDVLQNKKPGFQYAPEYNGHFITGTITDSKSGLPAKNIDCYLSVPGRVTQFHNAMSDQMGGIKFEMKNFYGSKEIIMQTDPTQDTGYLLDIANPFSACYTATPLPQFLTPDKDTQCLLYATINTEAQHAYLGNKLQQFAVPVMDTSAFYAIPDEKYLLDNYTRFTTMEEILREYVIGVNISKKEGILSLTVTDKSSKLHLDEKPLVLLDGVPVFDIDGFIKNYDPLKIYKLEVVRSKYFLGYKSFDGILNFITYSGDLAGFEVDPRAVVLDYEGLEMQRKFYAPNYETGQQTSGHLPDFRNLLCWIPGLKTDELGQAKADFYTSDLPGRYAVVLEGINPNGTTGSQMVFLQVFGKSK